MPIEEERRQLREAIRLHTQATGSRPLGWYTGRTSPQTRQLVMAEGGFLYDSDRYADDLPYWLRGPNGPPLVIPYTLDSNDIAFATAPGLNRATQVCPYLRPTPPVSRAVRDALPTRRD